MNQQMRTRERSDYNHVLFCELFSGSGAFKPLNSEMISIKFGLQILVYISYNIIQPKSVPHTKTLF